MANLLYDDNTHATQYFSAHTKGHVTKAYVEAKHKEKIKRFTQYYEIVVEGYEPSNIIDKLFGNLLTKQFKRSIYYMTNEPDSGFVCLVLNNMLFENKEEADKVCAEYKQLQGID